MNNQEYEQKKRECWEEYCQTHPLCNTPVMRLNFDWTFDCAYALGKQKEIITQADIERAAEKHADGLKVSSTIPGVMVPMLHDIAKDSYICGAQDTLGKQEKDAEDIVISGWVARDEDENLFMYNTKPERDETVQMWMGECANIDLRNHLFPDLTWDSDPEPVEITIKRKKNG